MRKLELKFSREKETKNTVRFREVLGGVAYSEKDYAIGVIYIQKQALGTPAPQRLKVVIEEAANGKKS